MLPAASRWGEAVGETDLSGAVGAAMSGKLRWRSLFAILCIPAIWILASRFAGIDGDARIYMGRAMADLDPAGVGRDMMFAQDGQSAFSIFRLFAAKLVGVVGPKNAALALAVLNLTVWFSAMVALASRFARGRPLAVLLVCAAVLPCFYGFYPLMTARETIAVPRPLSEAAVLAALAALCAGRTPVTFALLGLATLLHPIMALPGFAVAFVVLGRDDRRWFAVPVLGLCIALAAALVGVPILTRLTSVIDPPWRALLENRTPYLFVGMWSVATLAPLTLQVATLVIGALLCTGRPRTILLAALGVGLGGVAVAWLFGDRLSLLLVVQAQPWRSLWLVSVLAMLAFGLCALRLPHRGALGHIALAVLALAWISFDVMPVTPIAAVLALGLAVVSGTRRPVVAPFFVPAVWAIAACAAVVFKWQDVGFAMTYVASFPAGMRDPLGPLWRCGVLAAPLILSALAWARWRSPLEPLIAGIALAVLAALIATTWDTRSAAAKRVEAAIHDPDLAALTASRPGEVLWFTGDDAWYWLGRPQWNSATQGAGIVFSRALAMQWSERTAFLIALGLVDQDRLRPWRGPPKIIVPRLTAAAVLRICARSDAPAWIVAPLPEGVERPVGLDASIWRAPVEAAAAGLVDETIRWSVFRSYAVVPCEGEAAKR